MLRGYGKLKHCKILVGDLFKQFSSGDYDKTVKISDASA
jgi:hypothetical protein